MKKIFEEVNKAILHLEEEWILVNCKKLSGMEEENSHTSLIGEPYKIFS